MWLISSALAAIVMWLGAPRYGKTFILVGLGVLAWAFWFICCAPTGCTTSFAETT
jgi:hypothetical protein